MATFSHNTQIHIVLSLASCLWFMQNSNEQIGTQTPTHTHACMLAIIHIEMFKMACFQLPPLGKIAIKMKTLVRCYEYFRGITRSICKIHIHIHFIFHGNKFIIAWVKGIVFRVDLIRLLYSGGSVVILQIFHAYFTSNIVKIQQYIRGKSHLANIILILAHTLAHLSALPFILCK